jgi:hypothetical protein
MTGCHDGIAIRAGMCAVVTDYTSWRWQDLQLHICQQLLPSAYALAAIALLLAFFLVSALIVSHSVRAVLVRPTPAHCVSR